MNWGLIESGETVVQSEPDPRFPKFVRPDYGVPNRCYLSYYQRNEDSYRFTRTIRLEWWEIGQWWGGN